MLYFHPPTFYFPLHTLPCYISIRQDVIFLSTPQCYISIRQHFTSPSTPFHMISLSAEMLFFSPPTHLVFFPPSSLTMLFLPPLPWYFALRHSATLRLFTIRPSCNFSLRHLHVVYPSATLTLFLSLPLVLFISDVIPPVTPYVIFPSALLPHIYSTPRALISPSATPLSNSPSS